VTDLMIRTAYRQMPVYVAVPATEGPWPGVVVVHDFGRTPASDAAVNTARPARNMRRWPVEQQAACFPYWRCGISWVTSRV